MFHNLNFPSQPLVLVDNTFVPVGVISHKFIMAICHQIYNMFYPFIVNLMNYSYDFLETSKNVFIYGYKFIVSNHFYLTNKMNMTDILFSILVISFVVLSTCEMIYMLCNYLYSTNRDFEMEKMADEIKAIKKQHYARSEAVENIDYKLHKLDMDLAKVNRHVQALKRANKMYDI